MPTKYAHTNIVAEDWQRLARFYREVFGCEQIGPARDLAGAWLDRASGVAQAHLQGVHLQLPGHGPGGPTLEIFSYAYVEVSEPGPANRRGFGHIAFGVDDVDETLAAVIEHGGSRLGEPVTTEVPGAGKIRLVYARDPEGNIIELQNWI